MSVAFKTNNSIQRKAGSRVVRDRRMEDQAPVRTSEESYEDIVVRLTKQHRRTLEALSKV